jgi:hypothetical protein
MLNFDRRPIRAKFIPCKIWNELDLYKNDIAGLRLYARKWRTKVVEKKPKKADKEFLPIGGEFNIDDNQIEIHLWSHGFDKFQFSERAWNRTKYKFIQVMMHELIHFKQYYGKSEFYRPGTAPYKKTGVKRIDENREYHSSKDEIEAYAHCIYLDFKCFRSTIPIKTLIHRSLTHKDSATLTGIHKVFSKDIKNNDAFFLLAKKILQWQNKYSRSMQPKYKAKTISRIYK